MSGIRVKINANTGGIIVRPSFATPTNPTTTINIKNQTAVVTGRLDTLEDVVETPIPAAGSTLIYNPSTDKYEVQRLDFTDVDGPLDGGDF
jgi:hypothetical protein